MTLSLSPNGQLYFVNDDKEPLSPSFVEKCHASFELGSGHGLLYLGVNHFPDGLSSNFAFWQKFSRLFITQICKTASMDQILNTDHIQPPSTKILQNFVDQNPFMRGSEYLNIDTLTNLWHTLNTALTLETKPFAGKLQDYLNSHNSNWNLIGRVCFHLAENKNNTQFPFAFLSTYTHKLSAITSDIQHLPLGRALQEYANDQTALLALLLPVQKAATHCSFIKELVDSSQIFHPLAWSPQEAYQFLKAIPIIESSGVLVRVPNWWKSQGSTRPKVTVSVGKNQTSNVGTDALLGFDMHVALSDGTVLSQSELYDLLNTSENLVQIRGQWIEINQEKLSEVLHHWKTIQKQSGDALSFSEALRLLSGAPKNGFTGKDEAMTMVTEWSNVIADDWFLNLLNSLRHPENNDDALLQKVLHQHLKTKLRPYQMNGVKWLWLLYNLQLGGCLADDMGLGKTIQILSLLLLIKYHRHTTRLPHLLIVPASLLGNWQLELIRFAPDLKFLVIHRSTTKNDEKLEEILNDYDVVITTYGFVQRWDWFTTVKWEVVILDEAQTIKNPNAKQTKSVKILKSKVRFTLTGTPVENRLMDLWSIYDFIAPGLLGSSKVFSQYNKVCHTESEQQNTSADFFTTIRSLTSPYLLRRLKTDKQIIADLPDKIELKSFCVLTKQQVALYQKSVMTLEQKLNALVDDGIQRCGLILSYILRFKQICNHPAQWLGHGDYDAQKSGKFLRLQAIAEEIADKQEKVLIFTQFREIIPQIADFLETVFKCSGLILHGGTEVKQRTKLVEAFQKEQGPPFFVLSLKAGGTGLNLTSATHVIHFDRWWNPAVENQATDRAYRIGQKKNILVHKFICRGTIEEKIDDLIESKKDLSHQILDGHTDKLLTDMTNEELLKTVSLDIDRAFSE